jgi:hypothetical protein
MFTKAQLELRTTSELAKLCAELADSPTANHVQADEARALKHFWNQLMEPSADLDKREVERLRARMIAILDSAV